ncbi:phosphogluconate dehydratase [Klebsiella michiganensis]|uniref:Phosphogluconate dehydratase n=1 Tax=Klebsiella michiganensis TaxID=1134687 RepID=A0A7H4MWF6_9ENTR|nr:phosphogluconate dehydratase [Klebsiella michiganensis]
MPPLGVLLDRRFKIALVTDGRLSGASGKVPSAIHVTPEAYDGGLLAKVRDGDIIRVNGQTGELTLLVDDAELAARQAHIPDLSGSRVGTGGKCSVRCVRNSPEQNRAQPASIFKTIRL